MTKHNLPIHERIYSKVETGPKCWVWTGETLPSRGGRPGYGRINIQGKGVLAHRAAWELVNGPIPDGMMVLHHCDNPPCVKTDPDEEHPNGHLYVGTRSDNMQDRSRRGRYRGRHKEPTRVFLGPPTPDRRAKLTADQVAEIRALRGGGAKVRDLAVRFGVSGCAISLASRGKSWKHI